MLAYFGWPRAHEDDAERAVRAGLDMTAAVGRLTGSDGAPLSARVGIATGLVMVGDLLGEGAAKDQEVVGATPNLAARLQGLAEPGTVVIASPTRHLLGGLFELTDLGEHDLKGFAGPTQAWGVVSESRAESRFEALHGQKLTGLVGREHEIGLLVDRWERAKEREGQVVLLSGEPGIGKSRIVRALRERLGDEPLVALSHYCSPYHTNTALYPVIGLLERAAGFGRDDEPETRLDKLEALLARGTKALAETVPLVAALLGIATDERYPVPALSPQRQKQDRRRGREPYRSPDISSPGNARRARWFTFVRSAVRKASAAPVSARPRLDPQRELIGDAGGPGSISGTILTGAAEHAELLRMNAVVGGSATGCEAQAEQFPDRRRPARHAHLKAPVIDRAQFVIVEHDLQSPLAGSLNHRTALPAYLWFDRNS